ncbi:MAG: PQQ-binding-like beta-propeller repeat protein [Bacteriovoracaceae bacterium]|nr:PQQ-binding-like beta-propeller repeat protein [Bacteriovoracaceae bacterium]
MFKLFVCGLAFAMASCSSVSDYLPSGVKNQDNPFKVSWSKNNDPVHETGNLPIALNSPLIHDDILYVGHNEGMMMAYQVDNGRTVWSKKDNGSYHAAPVAYKDQVIYGTTEGRLYSRDLLTGESKFEVDLGASIETAPVIYKGRVLLQTRNHKLFCLDASTGKILWSYKRSVPFLTTLQRASKPVVHKSKIFMGFADGTVAAFNLEEGMLLWERKIADGTKFIDVDSTPVIFAGKLLMSTLAGNVAVINPNTGGVIRRLPVVSSRAPFVDNKTLVLGTSEGELIKFNSSLEQTDKVKIADGGISSIAVWKGSYAFSTIAGELGLVDKNNLKLKKIYHLGHSSSAVFGGIEIGQDGRIAVLSSRNRLYVFK